MLELKRYQCYVTRLLPYLAIVIVVGVISTYAIGSTAIDGLDSAHHIMDGIFFRDLLVDQPLAHPIAYTLDYYRKYPALGFLYWPPLFPSIEGFAFLFTGIDIRTSRACILCFGVILGIVFYRLLQRRHGSLYGFLGAILLVSTPLVASYLNQVMLEVPAIAMGLLTIAAYRRLATNEDAVRLREGILFAVVAAAAAYTKQTIVFVYAAIACDVLVHH